MGRSSSANRAQLRMVIKCPEPIIFADKEGWSLFWGLNVGKFIKILTYQRLTPDANLKIAAVASRISRVEGMEGHARSADIRLRKYYPDEEFDFRSVSAEAVLKPPNTIRPRSVVAEAIADEPKPR